MKFLILNISERDYSAQETMHLLMGYLLYKSSRNFTVLPIFQNNWKKFEVILRFYSIKNELYVIIHSYV